MTLHLPNVRFGLTLLLFSAVVGGMYLGTTFNEQAIKDGYHVLEESRFFLRDAHSHGNFMAFYNIFAGLLLANLGLSDRVRKVGSYSAMAAVFLPLGLAVHGITGNQTPIGMIGILGVTLSLGIMVYGAWTAKAN